MKVISIFFGVIFLSIMSATLSNMYDYGYNFNDGFWRVIWAIDEGTIWSPDFDEKKFDLIKIGMSSKEVLELLGNPLDYDENCVSSCFWCYTKQDSGTSDFDQRCLVLDKNKVVEIRKSFFID